MALVNLMSPTVTFGFALGGVFDFKLIIPYLISQILGAITGAALAMVSLLFAAL